MNSTFPKWVFFHLSPWPFLAGSFQEVKRSQKGCVKKPLLELPIEMMTSSPCSQSLHWSAGYKPNVEPLVSQNVSLAPNPCRSKSKSSSLVQKAHPSLTGTTIPTMHLSNPRQETVVVAWTPDRFQGRVSCTGVQGPTSRRPICKAL